MIITVYANSYDGWETLSLVKRDAHGNVVSYQVDPHPESHEEDH